MRYAIATDDTVVSAHFGRCPYYTIFDLADKAVANRKVEQNPGHSPRAIPEFLQKLGVKCIICGGLGGRASSIFDEMGIEKITGVAGDVEVVIQQLIDGTLVGGESFCSPGDGKGYGLDKVECDHDEHDHEH